MTTLSIPCEACEMQRPLYSGWQQLRAIVFWGAVGVVLVSPAILSALILLQG